MPSCDFSGQVELPHRFSDHLRLNHHLGRAPQAEQHHADKDEEHQQGYPQGKAQPCHRAYLRSRRSRPPSATRPPAAPISPPSQISVTNGSHQVCTCQRPSPPALPSPPERCPFQHVSIAATLARKRGVYGKSVTVRVPLGGRSN